MWDNVLIANFEGGPPCTFYFNIEYLSPKSVTVRSYYYKLHNLLVSDQPKFNLKKKC